MRRRLFLVVSALAWALLPVACGEDPVAPDGVPPSAVEDLKVMGEWRGDTFLVLRWRAPGDDGPLGTATRYLLRYSTSEITEDTFPGATPVASVPAPRRGGGVEQVRVDGLEPETVYRFALVTEDETGNRSPLSNVIEAATVRVPVQGLATWGEIGSPVPLNFPRGIGYSPPLDRVYIANERGDFVGRYTVNGLLSAQRGRFGSGSGEFQGPYDVTVSPGGFVFVTDRFNGRVQKFDHNLLWLATLGQSGNPAFGFQEPWGVAAVDDDVILVSDVAAEAVYRIGADGSRLATWTAPDAAGWNPAGVARAEDGSVWVTDLRNHRLIRYAESGAVLGMVGAEGSEPGEFRRPTDVAVDNRGRVWVVDSENDRLQVLDADGVLEFVFGGRGTGLGQMERPHGIVVTPDDTIFLTQIENSRVQVIRYTEDLVTDP